MIFTRQKTNILIFFFTILLSIVTILYQLNFEDFWLDEMSSFWISDPNIQFKETLNRHSEFDWHNPIFFNLILKNFLLYTSYDLEIARILSFIFGVLSVFLIGVLTYHIKPDFTFILSTFLASLSIYIIKYSQELRPYSLLLMLSTLNMLLYIKLNNNYTFFFKNVFLVCFIFVSVINYSTHPFSLIIFFSQIVTTFYNFINYKKKDKLFYASILPILVLYFLFNYEYLYLQLSFDNYMLSSDIKNVFDGLYFPRFFGSKIMGYLYLILLITLIANNKRKIFKENINYFFLFTIFVFSYLIPLTYGLIKTPVIHDRYLIFILAPIIIMISCFIFELKKKIKNIIIIVLLLFTITNHYIEIFQREKTKPEFKNILKYIKKSEVQRIVFYDPSGTSLITFNYFSKIKHINENFEITKYEPNANYKDSFWLVCYTPRVNFNCNLQNKNYNILENKNMHLVNAKLIKIKN